MKSIVNELHNTVIILSFCVLNLARNMMIHLSLADIIMLNVPKVPRSVIKLEEAVPPSEKEVNKTEKVESSTANNKGNKEEQKKVCPILSL